MTFASSPQTNAPEKDLFGAFDQTTRPAQLAGGSLGAASSFGNSHLPQALSPIPALGQANCAPESNRSIRIGSWNVNSLRARWHLVCRWMAECHPDVIVLQETKVSDQDFPERAVRDLGYHCVFWGQGAYNGVAILSRWPLEGVKRGLPDLALEFPVLASQARYLQATTCAGALDIASVYVPNGTHLDSPNYGHKMIFFRALEAHMSGLAKCTRTVVVAGDFNVAATPADTYDHKLLKHHLLGTLAERQHLRQLFYQGWFDSLSPTMPFLWTPQVLADLIGPPPPTANLVEGDGDTFHQTFARELGTSDLGTDSSSAHGSATRNSPLGGPRASICGAYPFDQQPKEDPETGKSKAGDISASPPQAAFSSGTPPPSGAMGSLGQPTTLPATKNPFTWWDYRAARWPRDEGMRIDLCLLSPWAQDRFISGGIWPLWRDQPRPSDHAPLWVDLRL